MEQQETNTQRVKRRMSQNLKLSVPSQQDQTLQDLSKHGSFQNGNMVIDQTGVRVIGDKSLAQSLGGMSLESIGQGSTTNMESLCEQLVQQQENQQIQKDKDGFGIPMGKTRQQNNQNQQQQQQVLNQQEIEQNAQQYYNQFISNKDNSSQQEINLLQQTGNQEDLTNKQDEQTIFNIQQFQIPFNEIKKLQVIGSGSAGMVEKALHEPTNTHIALKSIPLNTDESFKKQINIELNTLIKCNSDHIVKCYGACLHQGSIAIALEYMDMGTLSDVLKKVGKVPEGVLGIITCQILKGLDYLHNTLKVIHRDIKPQNILVSSTGDVKIADFGVSGRIITNQDTNTWLGTVTYMSPERFKGEAYKSDTDLWSLGITLVELAKGKYPYFNGDENEKKGFWELLDEIQNTESPRFPEDFSEEMQDFLKICLSKDSSQRQTSKQLLQHPLILLYQDVDKSFLKDWLEPL